MTDKIPPIHPGEILREEFLEPMGVTPNQLAVRLGVPSQRVYEILAGKRAITLDTALRLAAFFGTSWEMWTGLQDLHEMQKAQDEGLVQRIKSEVVPLKDAEKRQVRTE
jgi:addiction module HigA family antidote